MPKRGREGHREVSNALGVEELSDDVRGLGEANGLAVLGHGPVPVALTVLVVRELEHHLVHLLRGVPRRAGQGDAVLVEVHLEEDLEFGLGIALPQPQQPQAGPGPSDCGEHVYGGGAGKEGHHHLRRARGEGKRPPGKEIGKEEKNMSNSSPIFPSRRSQRPSPASPLLPLFPPPTCLGSKRWLKATNLLAKS